MASNNTMPRTLIPIYDYSVLWFSNTFVWRCPTSNLLNWYNTHITSKHLDVGPGSGYFLEHCIFPVERPTVTLLDLNITNLTRAANRIADYNPQIYVADIRQSVPLTHPVDSVALNYVLHVVPGALKEKGNRIFTHIREALSTNGIVFGSTILGREVSHNWLARRFLSFYNDKGIFYNRDDTPVDLEQSLRSHFQSYSIRIVGSVALFVGQV